MIRKLIFSLTVILVVLVTMSCTTPELTPTPTTEPEIPTHFSTYTSEGLFSISYPPDWVPAISIMEELWEEAIEWIKSVDPELETEGYKMLFLGGIPTEEGYYPSVSIMIAPRSVGFWTLDEIIEADNAWSMEHLQEYREYSLLKTTIDGREAAISDWKDYDPDLGTWRYITAYTIKGKFLWLVTCSSESKDFKDYEDTFQAIVRSLRILQ